MQHQALLVIPDFFLFDEAEWTAMLASFVQSEEWSGIRVNLTKRQRMATVASISPWHILSQVAVSVKSWWRPSLRLPANHCRRLLSNLMTGNPKY
jgi:hypothetical protein